MMKGLTALGVDMELAEKAKKRNFILALAFTIGLIAGIPCIVVGATNMGDNKGFVALLVFGLAVGKFSDKRMDSVAAESAANAASRDALKDMGDRLDMEAGLSASISDGMKQRIKRLAERIGYITPSDSTTAAMLEDKLSAALTRLAAAVARGEADDEVEEALANAENIVAQRIRTT